MDKKEFLQQVEAQIRTYLPEAHRNAKVLVGEFAVGGEMRHGFALLEEGKEKTPALDLESFYENAREGVPLPEVLQELAHDYCALYDQDLDVQVMHMDQEQFFDSLHVAVLNFKKHKDVIRQAPYLEINDLAVIPMLRLPTGTSIPVNLEVAEQIQMSGDLILAKALANHSTVFPPVFMRLSDMAVNGETWIDLQSSEVLQGESRDMVYVLMNREHAYGASTIADKRLLGQISRKLGDDFYILPSSMSELLIIPGNGTDPAALKLVVEEETSKRRDCIDFLSENVYFYHSKSKEVELFDGEHHRENVHSKTDLER